MEKRWDIVLFIDQIMLRRSLVEILDNVREGYLLKAYFDGKFDIVFPFFVENEGLVVNQGLFPNLEIKLKGEWIGYCIIRDKDLLTIYDRERSVSYQILFLEYSEMNYSYNIYAFEIGKTITIGRNPENLICTSDNIYISKRSHAEIKVSAEKEYYITEKEGMNRLYINNIQTSSGRIYAGDFLFLAGLSIFIGNGWIALPKNGVSCHGLKEIELQYKAESEQKGERFNIAPRIHHSLDQRVYKIEAPPPITRIRNSSIILTMGPSLTMAITMLISMGFTVSNAIGKRGISSIVSSLSVTIGMLIGSIVWPILRNRYQKKMERTIEAERQKKYGEYIEKKEKILKEALSYNLKTFEQDLFPSPEFVCQVLNKRNENYSYKHRLWERLKEDEDFLEIRLGVGNVWNPIQIEIPEERFTVIEDELQREPKRLKNRYSLIERSPITCSLLKNRSVGIIAEARSLLNEMTKKILINLIGLHSPEDVKIIVIYDINRLKEYQWLRKIPHIWSDDHKIRFMASSYESVRNIFSYLEEQLGKQIQGTANPPYFILFIESPELVKQEGLFRYLKKDGSNLSVVYLYGSYSKIPKDCEVLIECKKDGGKYYSKKENQLIVSNFQNDYLKREEVELFSEKLSTFLAAEEQKQNFIPENISLLELYQVGNVKALHLLQRWKNSNIEKSLAVPIGIMENGEVFSLDIHEKYHGSHGLVAGTTGSGKSEFLQTYILSLMINFSPQDIAFVLIDYKGGDMLKPFQNTPYIAASLDNMSSNMLYRALVSLKAENERRQKLLKQAKEQLQVDKLDINSYQKRRREGRLKIPMPHLIIIVDEFAELKAQNWEFLEQLVNIARVGRSLGVHLILATQRPSGQVDPQIWSNARFRICLKVQTRADSNDMLGKDEAAFIKNPGEFYVMVGYDELFVHAQSAYSGADYVESSQFIHPEASSVSLVNEIAMPVSTVVDSVSRVQTKKQQISAIIQHIIEVASNEFSPVSALWMPSLNERLYVEDYIINREKNEEGIPIAIVDDIKNQSQPIYFFDLKKHGNVAIYGLSETGKTTMVQTILTGLAYSYNPSEWCFYYFDMAGGATGYYKNLPHCGGVISGDQEKEVLLTLQLLHKEIRKRKMLFRENNCNSYREYIKTAKEMLPIITVVIDLYTPFMEQYFKMQSQLVEVISSGKTYGIYMIITSNSKDGIYYKVKEQINTYFMFYLSDSVVQQILLKVASIPTLSGEVPGRGILVIGEGKERRAVEFQTLLYEKVESESERIEQLTNQYRRIKNNWKGSTPEIVSIELINEEDNEKKDSINQKQEKKHFGEYMNSVEKPNPIKANENCLIIGVDSNKEQYGIPLQSFITLPLTGISGERNVVCMKMLLYQVQKLSNTRIMVFDPICELQSNKERDQEIYFCDSEEKIDQFIKIVEADFEKRIEQKENWKKEGKTPEEVYGLFMNQPRYFIFINGFDLFFKTFSNKANEKLSSIIKRSDQTGIYLVASENYDRLRFYRQQRLYKYIFQSPYGIICDGGISKESGIYLHSGIAELRAKAYDWKVKEGEWIFYKEEKAVIIKN